MFVIVTIRHQLYSQPSWQVQAVSDYLALVMGTSEQPSSSSEQPSSEYIYYYSVDVGTYNANG